MTAATNELPTVNEYQRHRLNCDLIMTKGHVVIKADGSVPFRVGPYAERNQVLAWLNRHPNATAWIGDEPLVDFLSQNGQQAAVAPSEEALAPPPPTEVRAETPPVYRHGEKVESNSKEALQTNTSEQPKLIVVCASDVQPEKIQWLWPNRFAVGKFSLVAGNPGLGKSQMTVHMAAQVTMGGCWPNGEGRSPLGSVIILSAEDDAADTLVPRLIAAGADTTRVHIVEGIKVPGKNGAGAIERQFDLANDVQALCEAIDNIGDVRLVIIDPVTAYLGTGKSVDSHKNAEVRAALAPLQSRAAKYGFAAVGVSHLNKGGGQEALMRVLGSLAFVAAARVAFLVVGDANNERTLFIPMKNNIGMKRPGLAFRVVPKTIGGDIETSCIEWDADEVTTTADEALAAAAGGQSEKEAGHSSVSEAMNFLRDVLADGPVAAKEVQHRAKEAGITKATLRRAQKALDVKARHRGEGGGSGRGEWIWEMLDQIKLRRTDIDD